MEASYITTAMKNRRSDGSRNEAHTAVAAAVSTEVAAVAAVAAAIAAAVAAVAAVATTTSIHRQFIDVVNYYKHAHARAYILYEGKFRHRRLMSSHTHAHA